MKIEIWIFFCFTTLIFAQNCKEEPRCRIGRILGMKGADCYQKDMRNFPQCISKGIEIIDVSFNRIRKLSQTDLKRYTDLQMLYLSDNLIVTIDEDTFDGLTELTTLDLSINAIFKLPPVVFHLPSLRSLYLGQNMNINIVDAVEQAKPITSPLVHFDISRLSSEEKSTDLPDLGVMPFLKKYNISGNHITVVSTKHFAGLCNLEILDSANVSAEFDKDCDCWTVNRWLQQRKIKFSPFLCDVSEHRCFDGVDTNDLNLFEQCKEKVHLIEKQSRLVKILIPISVITIILLAVIGYFYLRKRKEKMLKLKSKTPPQPDGRMLI